MTTNEEIQARIEAEYRKSVATYLRDMSVQIERGAIIGFDLKWTQGNAKPEGMVVFNASAVISSYDRDILAWAAQKAQEKPEPKPAPEPVLTAIDLHEVAPIAVDDYSEQIKAANGGKEREPCTIPECECKTKRS